MNTTRTKLYIRVKFIYNVIYIYFSINLILNFSGSLNGDISPILGVKNGTGGADVLGQRRSKSNESEWSHTRSMKN